MRVTALTAVAGWRARRAYLFAFFADLATGFAAGFAAGFGAGWRALATAFVTWATVRAAFARAASCTSSMSLTRSLRSSLARRMLLENERDRVAPGFPRPIPRASRLG